MTIKNYSCLIACCLILSGTVVHAQDKMPVKFGKVTPQDFSVTAGSLDSAADAVVVADFGTSAFEGNTKGWFTLEFHHAKRIRILKRPGFDAANITIPLFISGNDMERVEGLHASTYTLEDGKVVETKLDSKSIFTDKVSKNWIEEKFTFPALKEGAILEYSYTQTSPFLHNLQPWEFQGEYPCLWSEYQVDMPDFFRYVTLAQGNMPFKVNTRDSRQVNFHMTDPGGAGRDEQYAFDDNVVTHRWVMSNIPALKEEAFTTTIDNYVAKIEFQLSGYQFPNMPYEDKMGSWVGLSEGLLKDDDFGVDLFRNNSWLDDDMKTITKGATGDLEKARKIYAYVRDNFTCTSHSSLWLSNPLKTVYKNKNGSEADLNLLLAAMLIHEKIMVDPVILSTRAHGFTHPLYPLLSRFNYVIARATIDSVQYDLDASEPWLGFGRLPVRCYNGYARVLDKDLPVAADLNADAMTEGKTTLVMITNDDKVGLLGQFQSLPGYVESCDIRENLKEHGEKEYLKTLQTSYSGDALISNLALDSLKLPDQPLAIEYDIRLTPDTTSDIYYFNPMLGEAYKENPFKAAERQYPVEIPFAMDETYTLNMEIPKGYAVDELPKSAKVLFNTDEGFFEYLIVKDNERVQFRCRLKLKKANYKREDYSTLRDFFGFVVKKESEQIVFKKIK
jgi:Domain of Unknown Function with PDB structure (DUF3857)/Domain of Unknown Function with PDB structure (DUF3858)/Transglutaminase-like superfamily